MGRRGRMEGRKKRGEKKEEGGRVECKRREEDLKGGL